jgi:hypothetical protein
MSEEAKRETPYWINPDHGAQLGKKTHGRIWVRTPEDQLKVCELIRQIDEDEYSTYMPEGFVAVMPEDPTEAQLMYGHKFEIRTDLLELECWKAGIEIWIVTNYRDRY